MRETSLVGRIGRAIVVVDWAAVRWITPLRAGLVGAALAAFALIVLDVGAVVPLVIGALFVALADPRGPFPTRVRVTGATAVALGAAAAADAGSRRTR